MRTDAMASPSPSTDYRAGLWIDRSIRLVSYAPDNLHMIRFVVWKRDNQTTENTGVDDVLSQAIQDGTHIK